LFFIYPYLFAFFSYSGEGFLILYKESEENREIRNVRLIDNTDDSSILLKILIIIAIISASRQ